MSLIPAPLQDDLDFVRAVMLKRRFEVRRGMPVRNEVRDTVRPARLRQDEIGGAETSATTASDGSSNAANRLAITTMIMRCQLRLFVLEERSAPWPVRTPLPYSKSSRMSPRAAPPRSRCPWQC